MAASRHHQSGFTLIEIAVVLIIGGTLLASFSAALLAYIQNVRLKTTEARIEAIDQAMQQYVSITGALPCPSPADVAVDAANFGVAVDAYPADPDANHCDTLAPNVPVIPGGTGRVESVRTYDPDFIVDYDGPSGPAPATDAAYLDRLGIRSGGVPVRTLNLPDEYAGDAWGSRFEYAVTEQLTNPYRFFQDSGGITARDSNGNQLTVPANSVQYIIYSPGNDKRGGRDFLTGGAGPGCNGAALDGENCDLDAVYRQTILNSNVVGWAHFDDIVLVGGQTKSSELIPSGSVVAFDLAQCPKGWSVYAGAQGRTIVGTNPGNVGYEPGNKGGTEFVSVAGLLPSHSHTIGQVKTVSVTLGGTSITYVDPSTTGSPVLETDIFGTGAGNLDNRQPYIALTYCKKD